MEIIIKLVKNLLNTEYKRIPKEVIEITKLAILDTIGCIIAGVNAPGCSEVLNQILDWGGKKESTVLLFGYKVPCPNAAFVNSTMARALDFDATWPQGLHMSAASIPSAIAVSEICQKISGKDFLTAIVAGEDLAARIHFATFDYNGFEPTGVCGILGVTAIAGKLLGLDEGKMIEALAIAFNRAAGSYQPNIDGALMVRLIEGFTSRSGIEAALLAKKGLTGGKGFLNGRFGYFHLFSNDKYNSKIMISDLGRKFWGIPENTFKKYPACGGTQTAIEATLELVKQNEIKPEDVNRITVESNEFFYNLLGKPFRIGHNPQVDAQFSYQYTVANAVVRRRFSLEDITQKAINDPKVLKIVKKVYPIVNTDLERINPRATIVSIQTISDEHYFKQINYPKGSKQNPMSKEEVIEKFKHCVSFSKKSFIGKKVNNLINLIDKIEEIYDLRELIHQLK